MLSSNISHSRDNPGVEAVLLLILHRAGNQRGRQSSKIIQRERGRVRIPTQICPNSRNRVLPTTLRFRQGCWLQKVGYFKEMFRDRATVQVPPNAIVKTMCPEVTFQELDISTSVRLGVVGRIMSPPRMFTPSFPNLRICYLRWQRRFFRCD